MGSTDETNDMFKIVLALSFALAYFGFWLLVIVAVLLWAWRTVFG